MSNKEQLFSKMLAGELTQSEQEEFEHSIHDDEEWLGRIAMAKQLQHQSKCFDELAVPNWDRSSMMESNQQTSWWHWKGLPVMSFALSTFAIALVLLKIEINVQNDGLMISFANKENQQRQIEQLVDAKLTQFAQEQQVVMANYMTEVVMSQKDSNLQMAGYILEATRKERNQDLENITSYINDVRSEDALNENIKIQRLALKLTSNQPVLYQQSQQ